MHVLVHCTLIPVHVHTSTYTCTLYIDISTCTCTLYIDTSTCTCTLYIDTSTYTAKFVATCLFHESHIRQNLLHNVWHCIIYVPVTVHNESIVNRWSNRASLLLHLLIMDSIYCVCLNRDSLAYTFHSFNILLILYVMAQLSTLLDAVTGASASNGSTARVSRTKPTDTI